MTSNRRVFIRQLGLGTMGIGILSSLPVTSTTASPFDNQDLPRSEPETQGVSSPALQKFFDTLESSKIEFHSVMVLRHGQVIAEGWWSPYAASMRHTLYSLSKSFTSTAVGLAIAEGKFTVESPVISFFPNDLPETVSKNLKTMKVKHLLMMSTGHDQDSMSRVRAGKNGNWAKAFLALPVEHVPGTKFVYNTGATYMLSAIVQKTTGQPVLEFLKPRLFEPMGIIGMDWETNAEGINVGGYGLRVRTEDIAKFGLLYLQKGKWGDQQLIPAAWVQEATKSHIDNTPAQSSRPKEENDWAQGYGYQFWRCRHKAYRADGAFGQFCVVMPEQDAVVVITSESFDLPATLNLVWSALLPLFNQGTLTMNYLAQDDLRKKLKLLNIVPPTAGQSNLSSIISGKEFMLDSNTLGTKSISFRFAGDACLLGVKDEHTNHEIFCGMGRWLIMDNFKTQWLFPMPGRPEVPTPLAAAAHWSNETTLEISLRYLETAHSDYFICTFTGQEILVKFHNSVAKGNPASTDSRASLSGKFI